MKDRIIPEMYAKYGFNVDTSEWLAKTEIVKRIPLKTDIKGEEESEDGHWQSALLKAGVTIGNRRHIKTCFNEFYRMLRKADIALSIGRTF